MKDTPQLTGVTLYHAVRALYPEPSREVGSESYCVGGALLKFYESIEGPAFPSQASLVGLLQRANPALSEIWAFFYAGNIVHRNDQGDFEGAWEELRLALSHETPADSTPAEIRAA